jgi:hypothetical protein
VLTVSSALCLLVISFKHRDNLHSIKSSHNISIKAQNRIQAVEVMSTCYKSRHWILLCLIWSNSLGCSVEQEWTAHDGKRYMKYAYARSQNTIISPPPKKGYFDWLRLNSAGKIILGNTSFFRRRYAAACLLGLWIHISLEARMLVCCECACCQVEVSATCRSLVQRSSKECGVSNECNRDAPLGTAIARNQVEAPRGREESFINWNETDVTDLGLRLTGKGTRLDLLYLENEIVWTSFFNFLSTGE